MYKLVKEYLNEELAPVGAPVGEETSVELNTVKNIVKNAQALLDLMNTGVALSGEEVKKIAVVDANVQEVKNRVENDATEVPGEVATVPPTEEIPAEEVEIIEPTPMPEPIEGEPINAPVEGPGDMLPEPFPEDEIEDGGEEFDIKGDVNGDGVVNVLDVETKREGDED